MITPSTSSQTEYVPFNISFSVIDDLTGLPPVGPVTATLTSSDGNDYSKDVKITVSGNTINVSGTLSDVFNRQIIYLKTPSESVSISKFSELPAEFDTLYHYRGAQVNSITLTLSTAYGSATIDIQNNYNVANANLIKYVKLGKY